VQEYYNCSNYYRYSVCDLIRSLISCCVWSCDTGKINVW